MTNPSFIAVDRNFDDLAERFEKNISTGGKGELRRRIIRADIERVLGNRLRCQNPPLRVLDLGGGLGILAIELAQAGHHVVYNDISEKMTGRAQALAQEAGVEAQISWHTGPYQQFVDIDDAPFDLVLCHAVSDWLAEPEALFPALSNLLVSGGWLSLCFYNPAGMVYRNLVRGNFRFLDKQQRFHPDAGSLTPPNPPAVEDVNRWLAEASLDRVCASGIRVFSDYVLEKRGGLAFPEQVAEREFTYATQEPYKWMGRYLHYMLQKS
ncbi:tRNA 5-carboxymethoxyuridine methyltransferase [BD1-7 clade bacterium]|uniref:tRNA 5-carboxymethoxyuridine methyltransferase n=1 Tax=BD1-7 clade bacterium TaxID=2029982 RepID=A0A5S9N3M0_9GAMM|nr:tRNA 5-carboxymethoxyuridine methyltransferase [BD1-7 clade bacterium]CAA0083628.1 tRNA 5-carboxymethoxyuridine methyltransferase [BD1-7 clade bacterium]